MPNTINALTPNYPDVVNAIAAAVNGDTVNIPAGTATWTNVSLGINKNISLIGAGIGQTIINSDGSNISVAMTSGTVLSRLSGYTFQSSTTSTNSSAALFIGGISSVPNFRMDHVLMNDIYYQDHPIVVSDCVLGVVDHCQFIQPPPQRGMFLVRHNKWKGVGDFGHNSWATPVNPGSNEFFFVEDCTFTGMGTATVLDGDGGARVVFRYNTINRAMIGGHGSDTGQGADLRGTRVIDIYANQFHCSNFGGLEQAFAIHVRSGPRFVHNNIFDSVGGTSRGYDEMINMDFHRLYESNGIWGLANGVGTYDSNDPTLYASGTASTADANKLIVSGTPWTSNQWSGYVVRNTSNNTSGQIASNTSNSLTVSNSSQFGYFGFGVGDSYQIRKVLIILDQPCRGQSDLLIGSTPTPVAFPNNNREPIYAWANNFYGGGNSNGQPMVSSNALVVAGVDYFTQTAGLDMVDVNNFATTTSIQGGAIVPAGYTTFTYPHTLAGGSAVLPPVVSSPLSASGTVSVAFTYSITGTNAPTSFTATSLPSGLSVNPATGVISGTPLASGIFSIPISATNSGGTGSATLVLTISAVVIVHNPPVINSPVAAAGIQNQAFSYSITANNNPTSFNATSLPAGLAVNTGTGLISGTPTAVAVTTVTISATNAFGTDSTTLTITVTAIAPASVGKSPKRWKKVMNRRHQ